MSESKKMHVKKGDMVLVLTGKDKGKKGKVLVEGLNTVKRHTKPSQNMPQGGIIVKEALMHSAKVMLVCPACEQPTRIKKSPLANGAMARVCKKCSEIIDKDK